MKTRNMLIRAAVTGLLIAATSQSLLAKDKPSAPAPNEVIAEVNGQPITLEEVQIYMSSKAATGAPADPGTILNEVINRELIKQAALKAGVDKEEEFKKALEIQRTTLLVNAMLSKQLDKVDLSDAALKKEYDEQIKNMPKKEYKARHILLKTEDEAKAVIKQLKDGADFVKLAKEKSIGPSGPNGGDLGWFKPATMVPEFADAVKKLKDGEITGYECTAIVYQHGTIVSQGTMSCGLDAFPCRGKQGSEKNKAAMSAAQTWAIWLRREL